MKKIQNDCGVFISLFVTGTFFLCNRDDYSWVLGHPRDVKHHILEFVSPIAVNQGTEFILAVAVAWQDKRTRASGARSHHHHGDVSTHGALSRDLTARSPSRDYSRENLWSSLAVSKQKYSKLYVLVFLARPRPDRGY